MARAPLSRDAIIDAALSLADENGLDGLSMRTVAARLGVQAMSLYHHVENKAALIDGLHERLFLSLELDLDGLPWDAALRRAAHAMRAVALAHPKIFVLMATRPLSTPAEVTHTGPALEVLARAGLDPERQLFVLNVFFTSLTGLLLAEVSPVPGHADVPEPDSVAVYGEAATGENAAQFSAMLRRLAPDGVNLGYFGPRFDEILDVLIAGLRTVVEPSAPRGGSHHRAAES